MVVHIGAVRNGYSCDNPKTKKLEGQNAGCIPSCPYYCVSVNRSCSSNLGACLLSAKPASKKVACPCGVRIGWKPYIPTIRHIMGHYSVNACGILTSVKIKGYCPDVSMKPIRVKRLSCINRRVGVEPVQRFIITRPCDKIICVIVVFISGIIKCIPVYLLSSRNLLTVPYLTIVHKGNGVMYRSWSSSAIAAGNERKAYNY
jgi:hypothetical protein